MSEFWDARAEEDAYFYVDNRLRYGDPDLDRFWAGGIEVVDVTLGLLGVAIEPGDELVEIGCGVGRLTRTLAERGASVRALDVSARMLEQARDLNSGLNNVEWILGDGRTLSSVDSESVDACFSYVVFQHIPDPGITLDYVREMGRVLRPGGWSAFQISNLEAVHAPRSLRHRFTDTVRSQRGRGPSGQHHPAWLGSPIDLGRLRDTAAEAGMDTERIVGEGTQHCIALLRRRGS